MISNRSNTPIKDRAKRIWAVRNSKRRWGWHRHEGSSWEFRVLDVLWDIRFLLFLIVILLSFK